MNYQDKKTIENKIKSDIEKLNYKKAQKYAIELLSEVVSMFDNIVASGDCNQEDKINLKKSQIALEWVRGQKPIKMKIKLILP